MKRLSTTTTTFNTSNFCFFFGKKPQCESRQTNRPPNRVSCVSRTHWPWPECEKHQFIVQAAVVGAITTVLATISQLGRALTCFREIFVVCARCERRSGHKLESGDDKVADERAETYDIDVLFANYTMRRAKTALICSVANQCWPIGGCCGRLFRLLFVPERNPFRV